MFLGLDLGTSGLRGLIVDGDGELHADASRDYATATPHDGWSEQDPGDWTDACRAVLGELRQRAPLAFDAIRGIGISGHMHGAVMLDRDCEPVRPCIMWNDTRSHREAAELDADPAFRSISGNIVFPGFTAPKLVWMARNEADRFSRIAHVMLPKDYLVLWLTGELVSEMSDASGTSWLDTGKRQWSTGLVERSGLKTGQLPRLVEGSEAAGSVRGGLASEFGWDHSPIVVGGGADNACAACGIGATSEGQGFVSLGTSGVVLVARDHYAPLPESAVHTFCHAIPGHWYQMGVSLAATDCLNWLSSVTGTDPALLAGSVPDQISGPSRLLFLPYLSGERTPYNDAEIRGALIGLSKRSDRQAMTQAVMEGVAFATRDLYLSLKMAGANPGSLIAVGGGSRSQFWLQTIASTLGIPVEVPQKGEFGAALGAARLAMVGAGGMSPQSVMTRPEMAMAIDPDEQLMPQYIAAHERFMKGYRAVKELR